MRRKMLRYAKSSSKPIYRQVPALLFQRFVFFFALVPGFSPLLISCSNQGPYDSHEEYDSYTSTGAILRRESFRYPESSINQGEWGLIARARWPKEGREIRAKLDGKRDGRRSSLSPSVNLKVPTHHQSTVFWAALESILSNRRAAPLIEFAPETERRRCHQTRKQTRLFDRK